MSVSADIAAAVVRVPVSFCFSAQLPWCLPSKLGILHVSLWLLELQPFQPFKPQPHCRTLRVVCRDSQSLEFSISGSPARKLPDLKTVFHDLPLFLDSISIETLQSQPKALIWRAWKVRDREGNIKPWRQKAYALWTEWMRKEREKAFPTAESFLLKQSS